MSALFSSIMAILFLVISCGRPDQSNDADVLGTTAKKGRLSCTATFNEPVAQSLSGCTDSNRLYVANTDGSLEVIRTGAELQISLRSQKSGDVWSGIAQLRFPTGGTGTRARAFVEPEGFQMVGCEFDTLLSCNGR